MLLSLQEGMGSESSWRCWNKPFLSHCEHQPYTRTLHVAVSLAFQNSHVGRASLIFDLCVAVFYCRQCLLYLCQEQAVITSLYLRLCGASCFKTLLSSLWFHWACQNLCFRLKLFSKLMVGLGKRWERPSRGAVAEVEAGVGRSCTESLCSGIS